VGVCDVVRTCWIPDAQVERVAPTEIPGAQLSMDKLAEIEEGDAERELGPLVSEYRAWIARQRSDSAKLPKRRADTARMLLDQANVAARRIEEGIALLQEPQARLAFRLANRAMAMAARRRLGAMQGKSEDAVTPEWRPFQLAFLLMNLRGMAEPATDDRKTVDLLFFPTGGGKTEAYLGLAAFTLVYRRLTNPGIASAGLSVLMRYTLRLLTLDQLSRAATLICALELLRQEDVETLGKWPFEIGLWVGKAATPNVMGNVNDGKQDTARAKTIAFQNDDRKPSPIPLEECPWCGTKFGKHSFSLYPNPKQPTDLHIACVSRKCEFTGANRLPLLAVDEPIYRRLPCFMIATVDKFAAMPWTGEVGQFFGRVQRYDERGFYGPCRKLDGRPLPVDRLPPPDLIIQDELHLISGPLGTMVGLYESALDELSAVEADGQKVRPKIVASTATVRRAEKQIQALFDRNQVDVFPPPGPDRRDSFFAETHDATRSHARQYVGIAALGRSPKVVMLRAYLALLAAAQKAYEEAKGTDPNPADPYMTLLGYFNSLRELGGARRLVEDEVGNRLSAYGARKRLGEKSGLFSDRKIAYEVVELTSRVPTDKVAEAKRRLALPFKEKDRVDVALATNMISVGLDIVRLGLMVAFGQPKSSAEYIQATSRVGRDKDRPGLVVTILNPHRPRDRSHFERFAAYHETFYRAVEATSVTPFSPRALDRGLAGAVVSIVRQALEPFTPPRGAQEILNFRGALEFVEKALAERGAAIATSANGEGGDELKSYLRARVSDLLDEWGRIAAESKDVGAMLQYQTEEGGGTRLLYEFLNPELRPEMKRQMKFRANRSMRDVEPSVNLWLRTIDGTDLAEEAEA
jgi:hypothetical protein